MGLVFVLWFLVLFSMCFGSSCAGLVGSPWTYAAWGGLSKDVAFEGAPGIPGIVFAGYQGMFAVITPALMTGAFADRMRWTPYVIFVAVWMLLVYAPVCHWVWGGGWMQEWGVRDFAGGIVVHTTSGFGALAAVLVVGQRHAVTEGEDATRPHNVPFVALGTAMLWFGWFGFNGGSALQADGVAAIAVLNSQLAGSVALCGWLLMESLEGKKPGLVGACVGAVAGLATITPAAGFVSMGSAFFIGACASIFCYSCVWFVNFMNLDDALDVWGVHGMGGVFGTILLGVFAEDRVNPGTEGSVHLLMVQTVCVSVVAAYAFAVTYGVLRLLDLLLGLRPRKIYEAMLDDSLHGEVAYVTHHSDRSLQKVEKMKEKEKLKETPEEKEQRRKGKKEKKEKNKLHKEAKEDRRELRLQGVAPDDEPQADQELGGLLSYLQPSDADGRPLERQVSPWRDEEGEGQFASPPDPRVVLDVVCTEAM